MAESGSGITAAQKRKLRKITKERQDEMPAALKTEIPPGIGPELRAIAAKWPKLTPAEAEKRRIGRASEEREAINRQRGYLLHLLSHDCGERLSLSTLDNFELYDKEQAKAIAALRRYVDEIPERVAAGEGIFCIGPPGTGKDHLVIAIAREVVVRLLVTARWLDCSTLRARLRDAIKSSAEERRILSPFVAAGVLVLSDPVPAGAKLTDYQADALFRLIDGRYRAKRPTFVTANLADEQAAESALGSQTIDRLSHGCLRLRCKWESYRRRESAVRL